MDNRISGSSPLNMPTPPSPAANAQALEAPAPATIEAPAGEPSISTSDTSSVAADPSWMANNATAPAGDFDAPLVDLPDGGESDMQLWKSSPRQTNNSNDNG